MPHRLKSRLVQSWLVAGCLVVGLIAPSGASAEPSSKACNRRVNDTPSRLLPCIKTADLWAHMQAFQSIADAFPGPDGHASRNSGEPGYLESAQSVKDTARQGVDHVREDGTSAAQSVKETASSSSNGGQGTTSSY